MFKNIKISSGLNILMTIFVIFLVVVSIFNITSAERFDNRILEALTIAKADEAVLDAVFDLNKAANVAVIGYVSNKYHTQSNNTPYDEIKERIDDIDQRVADTRKSYSEFTRQPALSAEERAQVLRIDKAFNDMMNFTLKLRNSLVDPATVLNDAVNPEKQNRELRNELYKEVEHYTEILKSIAVAKKHKADGINKTMMSAAIMMMVFSVIMVVMARVWLKKTLFARLNQTQKNFSLLASGNLSEPIETGDRNEIGDMLAELEKMRVALIGTVSDIRQGVTSIFGSAQEIAQSNNELSSRTEQQASALQQTAASMEELKITVRQNADNAHSARQLVESASISARKGGDVMVNLDGIMQEITENSRQIADINGVIDSIANQTNILALNAAVEAARAGEQGRGFAVVAGEVRSLAKRSADAAKEIRQLINVCVTNMHTGSQEVELAGAAMGEVVKSVTQVTDIMSEITSASDEQSTGINQIAQAVNEMDSVTQQNASMVEQAASVARSVEEYAHNLEHAVSQFSLENKNGTSEGRDSHFASPLKTKKPVRHPEVPSGKTKAESDWTSF